jgi:hypothetical protein
MPFNIAVVVCTFNIYWSYVILLFENNTRKLSFLYKYSIGHGCSEQRL